MIPQHEGTIKIFDAEDGLIDTKAYYSKEGRKRTMDLWLSDYPQGSYFLIYPFARCPEVPKEIKKKHIRVDIKPKPFSRPPAIYDNAKSLY